MGYLLCAALRVVSLHLKAKAASSKEELSVKCDICGKRAQFGNNVSHSKKHTKRRWLPNIRQATLVFNGTPRRLNVCTRCLRTHTKAARAL
ncbi:MAG: 50S ribosomal protein L28 [Chloroflexota bacterium]